MAEDGGEGDSHAPDPNDAPDIDDGDDDGPHHRPRQSKRRGSLVALAGVLLLTLLGSPADELPSKQTVDVPALKAKS